MSLFLLINRNLCFSRFSSYLICIYKFIRIALSGKGICLPATDLEMKENGMEMENVYI